ncbi:DNA-directed RNA polymerase specialized sigma subunit, sigma24 family [Lentzea waywayandensis]|uniref:DNA-directed RNA polymerase specialized sigma subunit, sigma24 family n=2 Tax=Lentzea waywayandensis TaxID=84724 RepID=A0A1I6DDV2_9PSEU|nr:DNA-directed RNA polymerase specialized sigma subunit, sigma24 family [Lentzea waywayandensis]
MADARFYQRVVEQDFVGTAYDVLAADLVAYAFPTMKSWLRHGTIFARCSEIGRAVPHSDRDRERVATSLDDRDELAYETIAEALALFVQLGKAARGWSPEGGAALTTYFVGTCVGCFPNVWRRWRNEQQRHHVHDHVESAGEFDGAARRALDPRVSEDPADIVVSRDLVRTTLDGMQGDLRGIAEQLVLHGSTLAEIADQRGTTPGAVEQRLRRHRNEIARRRGIRGAP